MHEPLAHFYDGLSWPWLVLAIALSVGLLARGADWLVAEAVVLSRRSGISKVVIGATVISLGTTTPETAVSVLAALQGNPGLSLGNAVGSIICDTGLILGIACLIRPLPLERKVVNRQGWFQLGAGILLVASCLPLGSPASALEQGGVLPQGAGFLFLALLAAYLWLSVRWARRDARSVQLEGFEADLRAPAARIVLKLVGAVLLVVGSSTVLIPAVEEAAERLGVPDSILAATMVAFGTSLPELVTSVTAAWKGHGELAVGNVVGADILNVLFVAGASAAVTPAGLQAEPHFFTILFPAMLGILVVFRLGVWTSPAGLKRPFGVVLLLCYAAAAFLSFGDHAP